MRFKEEYNKASNSSVYNKARKLWLESEKLICCSYCPYHKNENRRTYDNRSWKRYRKTQYRKKDVFSGEVR